MTTKVLEKADWQAYLDKLSVSLGANVTEVEVAGLDIGDQIEAEWATLKGVSYDPKDDVVAIDLLTEDDKNVEHMVSKPVEVVVDAAVDGLSSLVVTDADGHKTIVKLRKPLALPE